MSRTALKHSWCNFLSHLKHLWNTHKAPMKHPWNAFWNILWNMFNTCYYEWHICRNTFCVTSNPTTTCVRPRGAFAPENAIKVSWKKWAQNPRFDICLLLTRTFYCINFRVSVSFLCYCSMHFIIIYSLFVFLSGQNYGIQTGPSSSFSFYVEGCFLNPFVFFMIV